jgi:membrane-bound lytic murein transglycosylase B
LTTEYRGHSAAATRAASELARAYAAVAAAEEAATGSGRRAERARTARAARTLALYAYGTGARSELSLLTARTPEEGLWRLVVGTPLAERVLTESMSVEQAAERGATADGMAAISLEQAAADLGRALARVRDEEEAARLALAAARGELRRLNAAVRRERAALKAAAELARAQAAAAGPESTGPVTALGIPAELARAYRDAAPTCPGMDWTLLAAVGQVESGHGRNNGPSSAGAIGPMQFMPATFAAYGVDGDRDGTKDAWDPQDAVFTAARYLCAGGAGTGPDGVRRALFTYNHAQWYVDLVLSAQKAIIAGRPTA